jgi:hypothetical protein
MAVTLDQLQAQRDAIIGEMGQPNLQFAERADAEIARLQSSQSTVFTIQTSRGIK